ncbi:hypothetical protein [Yinghuangia sp. YIM S09857]|uniref:hypothetical protein n=1 Tax=Yinghuangia sp. YIM S09857 TaxID=3436929 RepID=UPI003F52D20D
MWLLTVVNLVVFRSIVRERPGTPVSTSVCWGVFVLIAVRAARRRIVLTEEGPVLHGVFRRWRLSWADVQDIELVHTDSLAAPRRLHRTHRQSTWRVHVRLRDGRSPAVPSLVRNSAVPVATGNHHGIAGWATNTTRHATAPPDAPQELADVHDQFRAALLAARVRRPRSPA